jgi:ATPase subunit of ABC transporter with duplicated ATPase domains
MLTLQGVTYIHPNGDRLFSKLDLAINKHDKIALIGNNGVGKSTLLKIFGSEISPNAGAVSVGAPVYYVPQVAGQFNHMTVAEALKLDEKLKALKEILAGDVNEGNMETIGNDWSIEERVTAAFAQWKLLGISLDQKMETLSGGQKTKVFLAGILIHEPEIVLLDEPSNHLDAPSRKILYDYLISANETVVAVSHDRTLLNLLTLIYELSPDGITVYGGNYAFYEAQKKIETDALFEELKSKEKALRKAQELQRETLERKQKLDARGKKKQQKAGIPTIMMNTLRNNAEKSSSRLTSTHLEKINGIGQDLTDLRNKVHDPNKMKLKLDGSILHKGKVLISARKIKFSFGNRELWTTDLSFEIRSGERIAISGANGSGKTTLIKLLLRHLKPTSGNIEIATFQSIYVDQDYLLISNHLSVYEQAQEFNVDSIPEHEVKIRLNRFLFAKDDWDKPTNALSGGERMRLTLCLLSISMKAPDMIILDEPTNNLDLESIKILTAAINDYDGTLIVVSHDTQFLEEAAVERFIEL